MRKHNEYLDVSKCEKSLKGFNFMGSSSISKFANLSRLKGIFIEFYELVI